MKNISSLTAVKKALSVLLCISMLFLVCVPAFAVATVTITLNANGGSIDTRTYSGNVGAPIRFNLPTLYGSDFAGWYYDKEGTEPFLNTSFNEKDNGKTLYAKWDNIHFGFESYVPNSYNYAFAKNVFFEVTDGFSYSGKSSLLYHYTEEYYSLVRKTDELGNPTEYWHQRRDTVDNTFGLKAIKSNATYIVTYKYYFDERTQTNVEVGAYTSADNIWASEHRVYYPETLQVLDADEYGVWKEGKMVLTTGQLSTHGVNLCIYVAAKTHNDVILYIDDIGIYEITSDAADTVFYANGGTFGANESENSVPLKVGDSYSAVSLPIRAGYDFDGWYYDAECTLPVQNDTVTIEDFGVALYANWKSGNSFESYGYDISDRDKCEGYFGKNLEIVRDEAFHGNNSLRVQNNALNGGKNIAALAKLQNKEKYLVTFAYKVTEAGAPINVEFCSIGEDVTRGDVTFYPDSTVTLPADSVGKSWQFASVVLTTDFKEKLIKPTDPNQSTDDFIISGEDLFGGNKPQVEIPYIKDGSLADILSVVITGEGEYDVYLDDFVFTRLSDENGVAVYVDTVGKSINVVDSKIGTPIGFIERQLSGKRFLGWYSEPGFENYYYGDQYLGGEPKFLYAKWQDGEGFENYVENHNINQYTLGKRLEILNSTDQSPANTGDKYLRMTYIAAEDDREGRYDNTPDNMVVLEPIEVARYAVSFNYRVNSALTDIKISFLTSTDGNIWAGSTAGTSVQCTQKQYISKESADGAWHTATAVIDATPKEGAEYLYMYINSPLQADYCIDFDDIIITKMDDTLSEVRYGVPEEYGYSTSVVGVDGQTIETPFIKPFAGNVFYAWYADSAYTTFFTKTHFDGNSITVYGRFAGSPVTEIDFGQYNQSYLTDKNHSTPAGGIYEDTSFFKGKSALNFAVSGTESIFPLVTFDQNGNGSPVTLKSNTTYAVTFDYYTVDLNSTTPGKINIVCAPGDDYAKKQYGISSYRKNLTETPVSINSTAYRTQRAVATFTTGNISTASNALYIADNSTGMKEGNIYICNLKIYRVDSGMNFSFAVDQRNKKQYEALGIVGEQSGIFTPEETDNFYFDGWYTDSLLTICHGGTNLDERVTMLYSRWENKPVDFENYYFANSDSRYVVGDDFSVVVDNTDSFDGRKVMRYEYKPAIKYFETANNTLALGIVNDKTLYKIDFNYRFIKGESDVRLGFLTAHRGTRWSFITDYTEATYTIRTNELGDGWVHGTVYLKTDFFNDSADGLFMTVSCVNEGECVIDFDGITLNSLDASAGVAAFLNRDGFAAYYAEGIAGSSVPATGSKPPQYFAKFVGWYSDDKLSSAADTVTLTNDITKVYSKWEGDRESFENYAYSDMGNGKVWSDKVAVDSGRMCFDTKTAVSDTSARFRIAELDNNTTYKITYTYKTDNASARLNFMSGYRADADKMTTLYNDDGMYFADHIADGLWHSATVYITTGFGYSLSGDNTDYGNMLYGYFTSDGEADMRIDYINFSTVEAVYADGYQALKETDAASLGKQALRARFAYKTTDGVTVTVDGSAMTVIERGVVFNDATKALSIENGKQYYLVGTIGQSEKQGLYLSKTTSDFSKCWDYRNDSEMLVYSAYVDGFTPGDMRYLGARGYIKVKDSSGRVYTFYSSATKAQPKQVSSLAAEITDKTTHTFAGATYDKYTIVHPAVMPYIYGMKIEELQEYAATKGVTLNAVTDSTAPATYEIIVGNTNRGDFGVTLNDENSFVIAVKGTKVIISGGSDIAIMQGVKEFIEYLKLKDSLNCGADLKDGYVKYGTYSPTSDNYKMTLGDEFDGDTINQKYWGGYGSPDLKSRFGTPISNRFLNDGPIMTADGTEKELVRLDGNGNLVLAATRVPESAGSEYDFAVSTISTHDKVIYQYGCIDIKVKTTTVMSQSLWVNGSSNFNVFDREKRGNFEEYDICENNGSENRYAIAVHEWWDSPTPTRGHYSYNTNEFGADTILRQENYDMTDYHIYSFLWTNEGLVFAFDGKKVTTLDDDKGVMYRTPNYLNMTTKLADSSYPLVYKYDTMDEYGYYENIFDYVKLYQVEDMGSRILFANEQ